MPSFKRFGLMTLTLLPLSLSACGGEGWEMQLTKRFPYGNERTAGSGVEYVRASMMKPKGPIIEAPKEPVVMIPPPAPDPVIQIPPPPSEPVKPADPMFNKMQRK